MIIRFIEFPYKIFQRKHHELQVDIIGVLNLLLVLLTQRWWNKGYYDVLSPSIEHLDKIADVIILYYDVII